MIRVVRRGMRVMAVALVVPLAAGACGVACPLSVEPGLAVEVFDAATNAPLAGGALGLVYSGGTVIDTLQSYEPAGTARTLVSSRVGTGRYTIRITHEGYTPWEQTDVVVRRSSGDCGGLRTSVLQAALAPLE